MHTRISWMSDKEGWNENQNTDTLHTPEELSLHLYSPHMPEEPCPKEQPRDKQKRHRKRTGKPDKRN